MRPSPLRCIALSFGFVLAAAAAFADDGSPVAAKLRPFVEDGRIAGAVTLVATPETVLDVQAVGWADVAAKTPMTTDAVFWIASQSKPITGAALMILVDEGKVDVDAPVAKYIPEFAEVRVGEGPSAVAPKCPVLVRDVLTHTSGLPFKSPMEAPTLDLFPLADRVRSYAKLPLSFEPGTKFQYSNAGINTAGRIIEVASGQPYEAFLAERLFKPLGMADATFRPSGDRLARVAKSYRPGEHGLEETPIDQLKYPLDAPDREPMPAGGLFATADDVRRFYQMLANDGVFEGRRILSEAAVRAMTADQSGEARANYGFGIGSNGDVFTHGGAYGTNSAYDRKRRLITVFLGQHQGWAKGGEAAIPAFEEAARKTFGPIAAQGKDAEQPTVGISNAPKP
ncbi:MAG: hypothetical protein BGO49_15965 [Planctomycetales bacterium 71-10]|nr:MAG: hypothetical protein BGO49_15965 [Planctomycetales bacterium 71-10]